MGGGFNEYPVGCLFAHKYDGVRAGFGDACAELRPGMIKMHWQDFIRISRERAISFAAF